MLRSGAPLLVVLLGSLGLHLAPLPASAATGTGRGWVYGNLTVLATPNLAFTVMPGTRYEYFRSRGEARSRYMDEVFAGPTASARIGAVKVRLALWYYFVGLPSAKAGTYDTSHSLELIPSAEYSRGRWSLSDRVILHNTAYASVYPEGSQRTGYGLVLRELLQLKYAATPTLGLLVGDEPFFGVIEDTEAPPSAAGYWPRGLRLNRVYLGAEWKVSEAVTLTPQYVFESSFGDGARLTENGHYLFVTLSYVLDLVGR